MHSTMDNPRKATSSQPKTCPTSPFSCPTLGLVRSLGALHTLLIRTCIHLSMLAVTISLWSLKPEAAGKLTQTEKGVSSCLHPLVVGRTSLEELLSLRNRHEL